MRKASAKAAMNYRGGTGNSARSRRYSQSFLRQNWESHGLTRGIGNLQIVLQKQLLDYLRGICSLRFCCTAKRESED